MNEQNEGDETTEQMKEDSHSEAGTQEDRYKQEGRKALIVDENGYFKDVGEGTWRKYESHDTQ